jgi:uncharacterized membrane protein YraQ (UPF0718 family)
MMPYDLLYRLGQALLLAAAMAWQVGWSLVLGLLISAVLQVAVPAARITRALGGNGLRPIALATLAGAASSSCSYAAAAASRALFRKGAGLVPSLAFLFSSTNLVVELGIILYLLLGWRFMAGEWIGGIVLIAIMSVLVRLTCPASLIEAARAHQTPAEMRSHCGHDHHGHTHAAAPSDRLTQVAASFVMDWSMLWKDLLIGFLIAGAVGAFVPDGVWHVLFVRDASAWVQVPANALVGPLVAVLTFVCSIGNVPLAAVLWASGVSFAGVLAFLYADLLVLPLLDVYRRYYGWRMAAYMAGVFYVTMAGAAIVLDLGFRALGLVPRLRPDIKAQLMHVSIDYTFWLNLVFAVVAIALVVRARKAG